MWSNNRRAPVTARNPIDEIKVSDVEIPLGVTGAITNTAYQGHRVRIHSDEGNTGGYLIYVWWEASDGPNVNGAFDDWVETKEQLENYLQESGWNIAWVGAEP